MPASNRFALASLASRQYGVFTRAQAIEVGVDPRTVRRWLAAGEVIEVQPCVHRFADVPPMVESAWMAAWLHVGAPAVLARFTAARIHGLEIHDRGLIHLLDPQRTIASGEGLVVHRSEIIEDGDRTLVRRLPVTSVARTLCDLARHLPPARLRRLVAQAIRLRATTPDELRAVMARLGSFRGVRALRCLLDELSPLEHTTRSELESRFLALTTRAGIPPTAMNHPVRDVTGRRRHLDAVYLPQRLPIELDGRQSHGGLLDWHDDLRRENDIHLAGDWRPFLRFTWTDVVHAPGEVVATLTRALANIDRANHLDRADQGQDLH